MEYKLQLHEFFIEGGDREKSHVLLHITEPSTPKERKKGYFFAVCELNNAATKDIVNLQNIVDEIESRYYDAPEGIEENSLETVLKKINRENTTFKDPSVNLHCVLGTICNEQITFSFCGEPKMILFYKTREDLYRKMDLVSGQTDGDNLFSQIVEGKVSPRDFLFVGTSQIKNYFTDDRLQKIISTRPARQSAEHIERILSDVRNKYSFGGLILHLKEEKELSVIKKRQTTIGSVNSLRNLFATENNTTNTLSPSLMNNLNDRLKNSFRNEEKEEQVLPTNEANPLPVEIGSAHVRLYQGKLPEVKKNDIYKNYLLNAGKLMWVGIKYISTFVWLFLLLIFKFITGIGHLFGLVFFAATNYQNRRRNIIENWSKQWTNFKYYLKNLPKTTKIFSLVSLCLVFVFIGSIFVIREKQQQIAEEKFTNDTIEQIVAHKNAAESAAIYKDNDNALNESYIANNLISQINCKKYLKDCEILTKQVNAVFSQVRKERLVETELIADWSKDTSKLQKLVKINNEILAYTSSSPIIMVYDLLTKQTKSIDSKLNNINHISTPKENDYAAILHNNKNISLYNPLDKSFTSANISYQNEDANISSFVIYNRRLYSLDIANNQIYKHENIKAGFGPGKEWIKDISTNVKSGQSITIDGDMFVSKADGSIEKLTTGQKQPFGIFGLDPALKNGSEIWTYTDKLYLYLLDSAGKRLIILEKSGQLHEQIVAKEWTNPTGMIIDEQNKTAFILDNNKIYQINL